MKLITAIINKKDGGNTAKALAESGIRFTRIATYGGFLRTGNVTLLIGVEDDEVRKVLDIIKEHSAKRMEPTPTFIHANAGSMNCQVAEVPVGGAVVFVTNVEYAERM